MKSRDSDHHSKRIRRSFSQAAGRYDESAGLQRVVASELIDHIAAMAAPFPAILDIGCGTGFLTSALRRQFPSSTVAGADFSHPMLSHASRKAQDRNLRFVTTDGAALSFRDETFDLVASSLAYQWLPDLPRAFAEAHRVLLPGGAFVFSLLGEGTFRELKTTYREAVARGGQTDLPPLMEFPPPSRVRAALASAGFHLPEAGINVVEKRRYYTTLYKFLRTVNNIGAANPFSAAERGGTLARGALLRKVAALYHEKYGVSGETGAVPATGQDEENIYATYTILMCGAVKA